MISDLGLTRRVALLWLSDTRHNTQNTMDKCAERTRNTTVKHPWSLLTRFGHMPYGQSEAVLADRLTSLLPG